MLKVLVIEDNPDHYALIEDALLEAESNNVKLCHKTELTPGLAALAEQDFDICLCDLQLPDANIDVTLETLKELKSATPIIVLTSLNNLDLGKGLLQYDVQDYLPKEELSAPLLSRLCAYAIERKQEQRLMQRRNADMQTFCASLSHDFRGHVRRLNSISTLLREGLEDRVELDTDELKCFSLLESSTSGINELIDGLSQFLLADHANIEIENVDLSKLFEGLQSLILDTHEQEIELVFQESWPELKGSTSQLTIVFHNLISNSIKYNKNSPRIEVAGLSDPETGLYEISVKDNGIGIDSKYFPQIFSPFKRLHNDEEYAGSGLGLSIVKRIVDRHHGEIRVESEPSKGSNFIVSLPIEIEAATGHLNTPEARRQTLSP